MATEKLLYLRARGGGDEVIADTEEGDEHRSTAGRAAGGPAGQPAARHQRREHLQRLRRRLLRLIKGAQTEMKHVPEMLVSVLRCFVSVFRCLVQLPGSGCPVSGGAWERVFGHGKDLGEGGLRPAKRMGVLVPFSDE